MIRIQNLLALIAPACITIPLAFAPYTLSSTAGLLVAGAWVCLPFCAIGRRALLFFSICAMAAFTYWLSQTLPEDEFQWMCLLGATLCMSLIVAQQIKLPSIKKTEAAAPAEPTPEELAIADLKRQIQQLVPWQYRAVEAEQSLEQERVLANQQIQDLKKRLEEAESGVVRTHTPVESAIVDLSKERISQLENELAAAREARKQLQQEVEKLQKQKSKDLHQQALELDQIRQLQALLDSERQEFKRQLELQEKQYCQSQQELSDLKTCYQHLMQELMLKEEAKVAEEYCPVNLQSAWSEADREKRRFQGLYVQLRDQFADQQMQLEKAREERFKAEEALAEYQLARHEDELDACYEQLKLFASFSTDCIHDIEMDLAVLEN